MQVIYENTAFPTAEDGTHAESGSVVRTKTGGVRVVGRVADKAV